MENVIHKEQTQVMVLTIQKKQSGQIFKRLSSTGIEIKKTQMSLPCMENLAFVCGFQADERQREAPACVGFSGIRKNKRKANTPLLPRMTFRREASIFSFLLLLSLLLNKR